MAKTKKEQKLNEEELKNLQSLVKMINQLQLQVGGLEVQKTLAITRLQNFQRDVGELQDKFRKKYGDMTIDINTGNLTKRPIENEVDTKN
tara:strand:+ start:480 stop:749 length:270 start_codon:yes stop_codon:yes gene_type:complete